MNRDLLNRIHAYKGYESKHVRIYYNWRPSVFLIGLRFAISKDYIEINMSLYFNICISIIF